MRFHVYLVTAAGSTLLASFVERDPALACVLWYVNEKRLNMELVDAYTEQIYTFRA